jgi:hypothetical protein
VAYGLLLREWLAKSAPWILAGLLAFLAALYVFGVIGH